MHLAGTWGLLGAAGQAPAAWEGGLPSYLALQSPESSVMSLNAPTPLVLACWLGDGGTQRVKVVDHEGAAGSVDFMDFLKENDSEIWGFRVQHKMPLLAKPQKGFPELICALNVSMQSVALGKLRLSFFYLGEFQQLICLKLTHLPGTLLTRSVDS